MASHPTLIRGHPRLAAARPGCPSARRELRVGYGLLGGYGLPVGYGLLAGYGVMAVTTAAAVAVGGTRHPNVALALLAVAAFAVATATTAAAALGTCVTGWLCYAGFITGRHAHLAWHGPADLGRFAVLAGAALCGIALSRLSAGRAANPRRTRPSRLDRPGCAEPPGNDRGTRPVIGPASVRRSRGR